MKNIHEFQLSNKKENTPCDFFWNSDIIHKETTIIGLIETQAMVQLILCFPAEWKLKPLRCLLSVPLELTN